MSSWNVLTASVPEDLDSPDAWALHGVARVTYAIEMSTWGYPDLMHPAGHLLAELREQRYSIRRLMVAVPEGTNAPTADDVVGMAKVTLPLKDNTHLMYLELCIEPGHTRRGLGSALMAAAEQIAAEHERTTVIAWSEHAGEPAADAPDVLEPPTGSGRINPDDAGGRFALHHGYVLEQAERYSVLRLPVEESLRARLHAEAAAKAGPDYRLVAWRDRTPDEWVDQVALLETRMSTDAPSAGLDMVESTWDADRVRTWEKAVAEGNHGYLLVAAEHVPTGTLAAFTVVRFPVEHPEVAFQDDTLVLQEHRGRRLGMLVKSDALRRLREVRPDAARIHTWNAEENTHMLSINVTLGFTPTGVIGMWQKRLG